MFFTPISPSFRSHLKKQLADFQPDILHLHMPNPSAFWVMTLTEARRIPWVVHWHADVVSSQIDWRVRMAYQFYRPMEQALLKRCSSIIVTSPPYLESSRPLARWKNKCRVIPLGMSGPQQASHNTIGGFPDTDALKVLAVGRLTYYKGFEYLIRATQYVDDIQITLVGDGEKREELQQLVQAKGLGEKVNLAGNLSDEQLVQLLNDCDCLCLPSIERTEAFGMVILEAARAGKPAVVTNVPGSGMSWVVENDVTGIVVPSADAKKLAMAFRRLHLHKNNCSEMGIRARKRFDTMFQIAEIEKQVSDLYSNILL
ncbi:glycosyltransferase [Thiolapillus sp.]